MHRLALTLTFLFLAAFATADEARPNIVLLLSDDQAWTDYGYMGHPDVATPHLDALAARSALFGRGYVPTGLCRPSLMTLSSGLYAHQHKTSGNDMAPALVGGKKGGPEYAQLTEQLIAHVDQHPQIAALLGEAGYLSHQSGKWWEGNFKRGGFTHGMTRGYPEKGGRHGDDGLKIGREGVAPVTNFIDEAVTAKKPFFIWYAPFMPHTPHTPPQDLFDKYKAKVASEHVAKYYAMIEWYDQTCGEIIQHIENKGLTGKTLFVTISDNGWIQDPDGPGFARRSKQSANEGGVRQPILYSWPGVIQPGNRGDQLASSIDIVPTMLAAAGVTAPKEMPGFDLMPCLRSGEPTPRDVAYGESFGHDVFNAEKPEATLLYRWVIEGPWKLILTYDGELGDRYIEAHAGVERRPQLYHLIEDPHENKNLASAEPERVAAMARKIAAWWPVTERKVQETWE